MVVMFSERRFLRTRRGSVLPLIDLSLAHLALIVDSYLFETITSANDCHDLIHEEDPDLLFDRRLSSSPIFKLASSNNDTTIINHDNDENGLPSHHTTLILVLIFVTFCVWLCIISGVAILLWRRNMQLQAAIHPTIAPKPIYTVVVGQRAEDDQITALERIQDDVSPASQVTAIPIENKEDKTPVVSPLQIADYSEDYSPAISK